MKSLLFGLAVLIPAAILGSENRVTGDELADLEVALLAQPNDLKLASEYRQAAIRAKAFDRSVKHFEKLVADHPEAGNAWLNLGFAYVDKIPAAGAITQVILADTALKQFTRAIEKSPNWLTYYTRGNSYLFWPRIFNRTALGIADLEKAMELQRSQKKRTYYVRAFIALGDGYWKIDQMDKARAVWKQGLSDFPSSTVLQERLTKQGDDLKRTIEATLDPFRRVDTNLREIWESQ